MLWGWYQALALFIWKRIHHADHQVKSIYIQSNLDQRKEGKELPAAYSIEMCMLRLVSDSSTCQNGNSKFKCCQASGPPNFAGPSLQLSPCGWAEDFKYWLFLSFTWIAAVEPNPCRFVLVDSDHDSRCIFQCPKSVQVVYMSLQCPPYRGSCLLSQWARTGGCSKH